MTERTENERFQIVDQIISESEENFNSKGSRRWASITYGVGVYCLMLDGGFMLSYMVNGKMISGGYVEIGLGVVSLLSLGAHFILNRRVDQARIASYSFIEEQLRDKELVN